MITERSLISCAKSALQKYVRRGAPEKAGCAAQILKDLNEESLKNRLYIIIAEDSAYTLGFVPKIETDPVGVAMNVASHPASKDFLHLISLARTKPIEGGVAKLAEFLRADKPWEAGVIADRLYRSNKGELFKFLRGSLGSSDGQITLFSNDMEFVQCKRPDVAAPMVERLQKGTWWDSDTTLLIAGICMAFCGQVETPEWKEFDPPDIAEFMFDWYCLDIHTPIGKMAWHVLIKQHRVPEARLKSAMFWMSSAKIIKADHRVFDQVAYLKEEGKTLEEFKELWERWGPEYQKLVVWASKKVLGYTPRGLSEI